jgi:outer membrane murein-binding lipoprotein Lpp
MATVVNSTLNQPGSQVATLIDNLNTTVADLTNRTSSLESKVSTLQSQVQVLQSQMAEALGQAVWPGPFVGSLVHVRNKDGDCTAALIYEDSTKRLNSQTISVIYVDPDSPTWFSRRDVRQSDNTPDTPFNTWHVPEFFAPPTQIGMNLVRARQMFNAISRS